MKINPISEEDAAAPGLWKKGLYDFEVATAVERQSKAGNDMTELLVKVFDSAGKSRLVHDYLVESDGVAYKTRHFAAATGMLKQYEKGDMPAADMVGKTGRCQLTIEKGKDGYPDKNKIQDYVPTTGKLIASVPDPDLEDEIPFDGPQRA